MEREAAGIIAASKKPTVVPDGHCINCGERVIAGVYCDEACREDYEARQRIETRTRRKLP